MRNRLFIVFVLSVLLSCRKENAPDCFKATGSAVTEVRYPGLFKAILVGDKFEVFVRNGSEYKVEVTGGEYLLKKISTKVSHDTLFINNKNRCNFVRGYKHTIYITITVPQIQFIENNGVGVVTFDDQYAQDSLAARVSNSGDMHVKGTFRVLKTTSSGNGDMYVGGQTKTLFVFTTGINYVNTYDLSVSDYLFVHTVSLGDCRVNAGGTKTFDYNIQNTGNIYYRGDPQVIGNFSPAEAKGRAIKE